MSQFDVLTARTNKSMLWRDYVAMRVSTMVYTEQGEEKATTAMDNLTRDRVSNKRGHLVAVM